MNNVISIIHSRKSRRAKQRKNPAGRAGMVIATALSLTLSLFIIAAAFLFSQIAQDLPAPEELALKKREYISLDSLSETDIAVAAVIAADPDFWSRSNLQLLDWRTPQETALSLRLVSDLLFWEEPEGLERQLRERVLAAQIVAQFGREQVLEWYLNNTYYGNQLYGIESAAQIYFGKSASDLNLAEAALLAVVGEAPALNPFDAPQAAQERQIELLHAMLKKGVITADQVREASGATLTFQETPPAQSTPAFVNYVLQQASADIPEERLKRGGFAI
ncbi:MAG: hypothetical protein B6I38_04310, partial [Anaerolineaceae bacterium 4572_5.1]